MSNTRPTEESTKTEKTKPSYTQTPIYLITQTTLSGVMAGFTIGAVLFPTIEFWQMRKQLGMNNIPGGFRGYTAFLFANIPTIYAGAIKTIQAAGMRSVPLSHKGHVENKVNDAIVEPEAIPSPSQRLAATSGTAAIISVLEGLIVHPFRNPRRELVHKGKMPKLSTWKQALNFYYGAGCAAFLGSFLNAFFCVGAKTTLEPFANKLFPNNPYPIIDVAFVNILAGAISGCLTTPFQVIGARQYLDKDPITHKVPSLIKSLSKIFAEKSVSGLFIGARANILSSGAAFVILNSFDWEKASGAVIMGFINVYKYIVTPTPPVSAKSKVSAPASSPKNKEVVEEKSSATPPKSNLTHFQPAPKLPSAPKIEEVKATKSLAHDGQPLYSS